MVRRNVAEQQTNSSSNNSGSNNNSSSGNNNNNAGSCSSKASSTASLNSLTNSATAACNIVMLQAAPLPAAAAVAAVARTASQQQQQQQHQQQQQQQSPSDGGSSNCSLPASPPLLQQTATPPQGAQIVPPVCALHHPQQQLALLAAMQHQHQHQHQHHHMLPPPSHQHSHPHPHQHPHPHPHQHQHQHQHGMPATHSTHTTHHHENGHGGGISPNGGSGGSSSASSVSSVSSSNGGNGGNGGQGTIAGNSTNGIGPPVATATAGLPPGPLYIQYPGEFFPSEYYIAPHPHEGICPQHPHHPHAHQHHHQPMCAISAEYGPTPVQMVSHNRPPPTMTVPVQVPPYVNENGTLTHVVLPPQQYQQLHPGQAHLHPAPFISANGTSHFYTPMPGFPPGPGPAGNGPPHYHMPPPPPPPTAQQQQQQQQQQSTSTVSGGGGGSASTPQPHLHSPHSPSPPNYRDERSQRQHTKLLRKLEKQRELNSGMSTPTHSPSPRRSDINGHHSNNSSNNNNNNIPMPQHMHNNNNGRRLPQQQQQLQQQQRNGHVPNSVTHPVMGAASLRTGSSVGGTSEEDCEDNSSLAAEDEEEDYQATIVEQISAIEKPEVIDISSRAAKIIWVSPTITDAMLVELQELRYQVLLSDTGKQCKYKSLYRGEAYECIVQDLQPGQEYLVRLQVHYKQLQGSVSEPTEFKTPACEPDQPLPPKLVSRTKSSINLRWSAPPFNGASIQHYLLEYDEGRGSGQQFVELAKTKAKHYVISKLQPTTLYTFRLAAVNEVGQSSYSQVVSYSTSGNPPTAPKPPLLQSSSANSLRLIWDRRAQDGEFLLQLQDVDSGHGYMNSYKGSDTHYECLQLRRASSYQFRLRAENEAGASPWSSEVSYSTASERPGRPGKPHAKGKIHGTHFKARWEPPADSGGADILKYHLELGTVGANFERIYTGSETEAMCERLQPGTSYQLRACCEGAAGASPYSEIGQVTTEAVPPAAPPPPFCVSPPTPYTALLRLSQPEYNGGAQVLEFEAQLRQLELPPRSVYRGKQDYFVAQQLLPGGIYEVQSRAINRIGAGNWSQWLRFTAAAAPPSAPESLQALVKSATHLSVLWQAPSQLNGSPVTAYSLQSATQSCEELEAVEPASSMFHSCYQGNQTNVELRNLSPYTRYYLRVLAINAAGSGTASDVICVSTPAAVPAAPQMQGYEFTAREVTLNWTQPAANGSEICSYNIEYGERTIATPDASCTRYTIQELNPETSYKFRVQAVNAMGAGAFSAYAKLTTQPAPPSPPKLECSGAGHNYIKLKWSDTNHKGSASHAVGGIQTTPAADYTKYFVEMYVTRAKQFQSVYSGTNCMCKVHKLQERSSYTFRIYAHTDRAGDGDYSEEYVFETTATLPANIKAPRVVHESSVCLLDQAGQLAMQLTLEWQHSKNSFHDRVEYQLQYAVVASDADSSSDSHSSAAAALPLSNQEYRQLYRGPETKFTIDNLAAGTCYQFRVCAVRVTAGGDLFPGQPSSALRYKVPNELTPTSSTASCHHLHGNSVAQLSQQQQQRSSRKLSSSSNSNSGLHLRSVSASAISGSTGVGANPQAIERLQHELSSLNACGDPLHHHHHHHHHHAMEMAATSSSTTASSSSTTSSVMLRGNTVGTSAHHLHHQHHLHHSHHMHHSHFTHPSAAANFAASNGSSVATVPTGGGIIRRILTKLTSLYYNRKRLTDQQKAICYVVSFVFVTFLAAMLVHMLWG